uniref:Zgc:153284 n=1 Tax=Salmo trutta TaxID=8032 RepID=A0A674BEC7_SALTR
NILSVTIGSAGSLLKQQQSQIFSFLDSKKIKYKAVDITQGSEVKEEMRKKTGNPTALPPQVFNKDVYCGVSLEAAMWTFNHFNQVYKCQTGTKAYTCSVTSWFS